VTSSVKLNKESLLGHAQLLLTPTLLDAVSQLARAQGVEKNDLAELMMMAAVLDVNTLDRDLAPDWGQETVEGFTRDCTVAKEMLHALGDGSVVDVPRTDRRGDRTYQEGVRGGRRIVIEDANVVAFRMAHRQDIASDRIAEPGGYAREGLGMSLSMSAEDVWQRARGYWRIRPDADYILPTRLGFAPYLFKVANWRTASDATNPSDKSARYWAQTGWLVDVENARLVSLDGSPDQEASQTDLELADKFALRAVRYPLGIRNPAVWVGRSTNVPSANG
jgi:hypothetical protein